MAAIAPAVWHGSRIQAGGDGALGVRAEQQPCACTLPSATSTTRAKLKARQGGLVCKRRVPGGNRTRRQARALEGLICRATDGGEPREQEDVEEGATGEETEGDSVPWYKALVKKAEEAVTIQERGDIVDTTLISLSIAVYVYMSMQLWRVYAHLVEMGQPDPFL
mmetsp:Transcript_19775/g.49934  ORF Transcript_19775/g.49934 Transcript_19775/m.49934 type:complete len:165 (+) Transcript_19775:94-588(+)